MSKRNMLLSAATAVGVTAIAATGAFANGNTPTSESMTDPAIGPAHDKLTESLYTHNLIEVEADNLDWAHARPTTLGLDFHIEAETTKHKWYIPSSYIVVGLAPITSAGVVGTCCGDLDTDFSPYAYANFIHADSLRHVNQDAWWTLKVVPDTEGIATAARNACRNLRKELEQQGLSQDQIFGQDRSTSMSYDFRYVAAVAHMDPHHFGKQEIYWKQSQPTYRNIGVACKKRDALKVNVNPNVKPMPNDISVGFQVSQAALALTPKPYTGRCPVTLHLVPTIQTNGAGTVKYRFVDQLGNHSQTFQAKFDKADIRFIDHTIEIDSKGKPKGLGFAAAQPTTDAPFGLAAQSEPNLVQGYFQVEVLSPHKKLSNTADYSVKCTFKTAGDGEIAAPQGTVKPAIVGDLTLGLPDLVIDSVQASPAVPTKLFVKVTNKGKAPSTPTNLKAIRWVGDQASARGTLVPAVQPGQSQVVLAELGGTIDGATHLYVRVDDPNRIAEQDEGNNSFKVK